MSEKHQQRYMDEFSVRQCVRERDTDGQMSGIVVSMIGRQLLYADLISD